MKMANFLLPKGTTDSHVNDEAHVDPDIARVGTVTVRRGPIGDIAASAVAVVVTNYGDDSVSFLNPGTLVSRRPSGSPVSHSRPSSPMTVPTSAPPPRAMTPSR